jgi:thiamine biosynthesis lipoprotein
MGTTFSLHVIRGPEDGRLRFETVAEACWKDLRDIERRFSPLAENSDIRRLARGELSLARADRRLREVEGLCRQAKEQTDGRFDAWYDGWFNPAGVIRGWAVDWVTERRLVPLLKELGASAIGLNAGGDMRLLTAPTSSWRWHIGITDPGAARDTDRRLVATLDVKDGAIATSGAAEHDHHPVDPKTGRSAASVASATVLADRLTDADLWATTAAVAGFDDLSWVQQAGVRAGLLVAPDGQVRQWANGVELAD